MKRDKIINKILAVFFFTILSLAWIYPMVGWSDEFIQGRNNYYQYPRYLILCNFRRVFANYIAALDKQGFLAALDIPLVITITSVALIFGLLLTVCFGLFVRVKIALVIFCIICLSSRW